MKALIIDLSNENEIKVLNAKVAGTVSVLSAYHLYAGEGENVVSVLAAKLAAEALLDVPAYVIPPRDLIKDLVFHFPPMPDKDIRKILPREIATASGLKVPVVFDFYIRGTVLEKGAEKIEVATFYCEKKALFELLQALIDAGLHPLRVVPEIIGLSAFLENNPALIPPTSAFVLFEIQTLKLNIQMFKEKHWVLNREFAFKRQAEEQITEDDLGRIIMEINRTFQFFKQKNRGFAIERAIVFGTSPEMDDIRQYIAGSLPIKIDMLSAEYFRSRIAFPKSVTNANEFAILFATSLATSLLLSKKKALNLIPQEFVEKENLPRRLLGLLVSAAIIGGIIIAASIALQAIKTSYRRNIREITQTYYAMGSNVKMIEESKAQREQYFRQRFFLEYPRQYSYAVAEFVRQLSLIANKDTVLTDLIIEPEYQVYRFTLSGIIRAQDNINAQSQFLEFFQKIKQFPNMAQVSSSNLKVGSTNTGGSNIAPGAGQTASENSELLFTISGTVELE